MNTQTRSRDGANPEGEAAFDDTIHFNASYNQLFTVEEAFVRLGQCCQNGELLVFNNQESVHVYVERGYVVSALSADKTGDAAFLHALELKASNFVWVAEAQPLTKDVHIDIREYLLRHALTRDLPLAQRIDAQKRETLPLHAREHQPEADDRTVEIGDSGFYFVPEKNVGARMTLSKAVNLVGREVYCDWVIDDIRISRKHCLLQVTNRGVLVRDLDSVNGTFVNGKTIGDGYLKIGDKLSLGGYTLTLKRENPEKDAEPAGHASAASSLVGVR